MKRLGIIHTVPFLADLFKKLLGERFPDLESFHIVDESLTQEARRAGGLSANVVRRIALQAVNARDAGADIIVFTCSTTSPGIDTARKLVDIPILKVDDPMAARAVTLGPRIGLMCTSTTTREPSENLILSHAAEQGREVEVTVVLENEAYKAVTSGDKARHDAIVTEAVQKLAADVDVIVLAQASMAHLAPDLDAAIPVPVLASPPLCIEALAGMLTE